MVTLPALTPAMSFAEASAAVMDYLRVAVPMGFWAVTRYDGTDQVYLEVRDSAYGLAAGGTVPWEETFCSRMVSGSAPSVAPDAMAVPAYAATSVASMIPIGAYVGVPIRRADGELFGTLCAVDPEIHGSELTAQQPLIELLSTLLSTILEADRQRTEQARALELAELVAEIDPLTGLHNRRGWDRFLALEEQRYKRFGDPGSVVVVDLDRLKEVNDTRGHAAGDDYIRTAAATLRGAVRDIDVVARLGGDEFGTILGNTTPEQTEVIVARIDRAFVAAGVAGSIGAAPYTIVAGFPGAWEAADQAMYAEKRRRRDARSRA